MSTCAECIHAELQCPPVIRCNVKGSFLYLDSPACEHLESLESKEESTESLEKAK